MGHLILMGFFELTYVSKQKDLERQLVKLEDHIISSLSGVKKIVFKDHE